MARSSRKPRQKKMDPRQVSWSSGSEAKKKKEKDWTFDDILRSKRRGR